MTFKIAEKRPSHPTSIFPLLMFNSSSFVPGTVLEDKLSPVIPTISMPSTATSTFKYVEVLEVVAFAETLVAISWV